MKPILQSEFVSHVHELMRNLRPRHKPDDYDKLRLYRQFLRDLEVVAEDVNQHLMFRGEE